MKQKSHSGTKKRIKVRKSGSIAMQKSCKQHLLSDKSKRGKKASRSGLPVPRTHKEQIRRLLPGKVR